MKIDFEQVIKTLDGKDVTDVDAPMVAVKEGEPPSLPPPLRLRNVAVRSLLVPLDIDREMKGDKKMKLWKLAMSIHDGGDEVAAEEVVLLKDRIGVAYPTLVAGQALAMLEAAATPEKKE